MIPPAAPLLRNTRKRIYPMALLCAGLIMLINAACSQRLWVVLVNHSAQTIEVNSGVDAIAIKPNSYARIELNDVGRKASFRVEGREYRYNWTHPGKKFEEAKGTYRGFCVQIESTLMAYVVNPGSRSPVSEMPPQPDGFPLSPEK